MDLCEDKGKEGRGDVICAGWGEWGVDINRMKLTEAER